MTLYEKIMIEIITRIETGFWQENQQISSESQLEKEFFVSNITVRRALNELENKGVIYRIKGKGSFVSPQSITKHSQTSPRTNDSKIITLLMPFGSVAGGGINIIHGFADSINDSSYQFNIVNSQGEIKRERELMLATRDNSCALAVYPISNQHNVEVLCSLQASKASGEGIPLVVMDKSFGNLPICSVTSDNVGGAFDVTRLMISKGHREIAFISDKAIEFSSTVSERFYGYSRALTDAGISVSQNNIRVNYWEIAKNDPLVMEEISTTGKLIEQKDSFYRRLLMELIDRDNPVTSIFCLNDSLALEIYNTALQNGISVPEKFSLGGFDNLSFTEFLATPLTTVEQDFYRMGYETGEQLKLQLDKNQVGERVIVPTKIIERCSIKQI